MASRRNSLRVSCFKCVWYFSIEVRCVIPVFYLAQLTCTARLAVLRTLFSSMHAPTACRRLWLSGAKKHTKQTEVVDYTKNPKWTKDTHHGFVVHVPDHQKLVLSLYDSDYGGDDEIGRYVWLRDAC